MARHKSKSKVKFCPQFGGPDLVHETEDHKNSARYTYRKAQDCEMMLQTSYTSNSTPFPWSQADYDPARFWCLVYSMHSIHLKNSSLVSQCCKDDERYPSHPFAHQPCVYIPSIWLHYYLYYRRPNQKNQLPTTSKEIKTFGPNQSEMLIFSHMNHCYSKIFTVCDYAGFSC